MAPPGEPPSERLYRELAPTVLGYLRAQGVDDAEDVLGDVFLQVVRDLPRFKGDAVAERRWVFTIAHNRLVDHHRRRRRRPPALRLTEETRESVDDRALDRVFLDADLLDALGCLTQEQRDVVVLRFVADLPIADVAALLGRRQGAVKALQQRGLARLASLLGDRGLTER